MTRHDDFRGRVHPGWGGPHQHGRAWGRGEWPPQGPPWTGARRMRRGDVRLALLEALLEGPAHGYELITRLEQRTGGMWRPSAGSVYPTLQMLEEEGKVSGRDDAGKRVFTLTDGGRAEAEAARARQPFGGDGPSEAHQALRAAVGQLGMAARQVVVAGNEAQIAEATRIVVDARQRIYRLLAGG